LAGIFFDIGIMIIFATVLGYFGRFAKQPLIPLYILAGIITGPVGLGLITDSEVILTLSEIGVAFLLFVVGLELDLRKLKDVGAVIIVGATAQIILMFLAGIVVGLGFGFANQTLIYFGLIVSFSSTMVMIKLLADRNELETLHGRIVIGILLMEDLFAIIALSVVQTLGNFSAMFLAEAILKAIGLLLITYITSKYVFPTIFKYGARTQEMLFLVAITICFSFGMLSVVFGFSIAIGAFLAGIALANLPYNVEIESKVRSLRDFFSTLFFVALGMKLVFKDVSTWIGPLIALVALIVIFKPILTTTILSFFGYKKKTSFMTSISLTQTSEFSLIIITQGLLLGHVTENFFSLTVLLLVITITLTTYFIKYEKPLYNYTNKFFKFFEKLNYLNKEVDLIKEEPTHSVVLVGYDRIGYSIAKTLDRMKKDYLVVDFNPDIIKKLVKQKQSCLYGDIGDVEIIEKLHLRQVNMVISTIPEIGAAKLLIKKVRENNRQALIIVTGIDVDDALELYDEGADYVIVPHLLGGNHISIMLEDISYDFDKLVQTKISHIKELRERKTFHHRH